MAENIRRRRKDLSQLTLRVDKKLAKHLNEFCIKNGLVRDIFIQTSIEQMLGGIDEQRNGFEQPEGQAS